MSTSRKTKHSIDRRVPGLGRLVIKTGRLQRGIAVELDRAIVRAGQAGNLEALRLLKSGRVSKFEFLEAARKGLVARLVDKPLIEPLLREWLASSGHRASTVVRYQQSWTFMLDALPRGPNLGDLTPQWWAKVVTMRLQSVGHATVNRDRAALLAFISWCRRHRYTNEHLELERLREEPKQSGTLGSQAIQEVQTVCHPARWPFFWTLLSTGARTSEVLNLTLDDIAADGRTLAIRPQEGTKGRTTRYCPIPPNLTETLRRLGRAQGGRIFPYSRSTVQGWWMAVRSELGITGVTIHGLRATFITLALDSGIPPVDVQKLAGHSDIQQTMRYYRNDTVRLAGAERIWESMGLATSPPSTDSSTVSPRSDSDSVG